MGFFSAFKKFFGGKDEPRPLEKEPETSAPDIAQEDALIATPDAADFPPPEEVKKKVIDAESPEPAARPGLSNPEETQIASGKSESAPIPETDVTAKPDSSGEAVQADQENQQKEPEKSVLPERDQKEPSEPRAASSPIPPGLEHSDSRLLVEIAEDSALLASLRQAPPRLSAWLDIVLEDQEQADARFWSRLRFFLHSLEAPDQEIERFIDDFGRWLEAMEYSYVDEFRSELQYKLALALDLEDEEDERSRLVIKLSEGLAATRAQLARGLDALFANHGELTDSFWEELEELFIMADLGYETSVEIVRRLKRRAADNRITAAADARAMLVVELEEIFRQQPKIRAANKPEVILMMGVNGAGKTTTIAKLAHRAQMEGKKTLIAAADTFRAAAIEQLEVWANRAGAEFYSRPPGSDPASVAWEALDYAQKNNIDVVFIDTAGRLQTRVNLMEELGKIRQVLAKKHPGAPHRSLLVLDATTGQNALSQAKLFREAAGADEIALTKLDGTSKGGVAIAVAMQEKLPITYIGLGEKMEDLRPFNGKDFAQALLGEA